MRGYGKYGLVHETINQMPTVFKVKFHCNSLEARASANWRDAGIRRSLSLIWASARGT